MMAQIEVILNLLIVISGMYCHTWVQCILYSQWVIIEDDINLQNRRTFVRGIDELWHVYQLNAMCVSVFCCEVD